MQLSFKLLLTAAIAGCLLPLLSAQDLAPRAYIITPVHSNAIILTYSFYNGSVLFEGAAPITDASARVNVQVFSLYHSLRLFGRSANITASLPYGVGNFQGSVIGTHAAAYRSGLLDSTFRVSVNLKGGPAMDAREMHQWHQKMLLGVSLKLVAPTGQYDSTKLLNYGANRWAFKPEVGLSRRWRHWLVDTYGGAWIYTANRDYFSKSQNVLNIQTQNPIGSFEGHFSYDMRPRLWASLDGNFWIGGRTSINGIASPKTLQENSRIGATVSFPVSKYQSLKFSYSRGDYIRFGGNFDNISVAWQYSWLGRPN
ncbi:MAG: transporter [Verrucomicrobia bacterium]|nr:transporter [Verrucomicrobiota bacterium]